MCPPCTSHSTEKQKMAWIQPLTSDKELSSWRTMTVQVKEDQVSKRGTQSGGGAFVPIPMSSEVFPKEQTAGHASNACGYTALAEDLVCMRWRN